MFNSNVPVAPWNESEVPQASDMVTLFTDTLGCLQTHLNGKTHASRGCLFDSCLSVSPRIQPASRCARPLGAFTMRSGCIRRLFTGENFRKQFGSLMTKQSGYLIFLYFLSALQQYIDDEHVLEFLCDLTCQTRHPWLCPASVQLQVLPSSLAEFPAHTA